MIIIALLLVPLTPSSTNPYPRLSWSTEETLIHLLPFREDAWYCSYYFGNRFWFAQDKFNAIISSIRNRICYCDWLVECVSDSPSSKPRIEYKALHIVSKVSRVHRSFTANCSFLRTRLRDMKPKYIFAFRGQLLYPNRSINRDRMRPVQTRAFSANYYNIILIPCPSSLRLPLSFYPPTWVRAAWPRSTLLLLLDIIKVFTLWPVIIHLACRPSPSSTEGYLPC